MRQRKIVANAPFWFRNALERNALERNALERRRHGSRWAPWSLMTAVSVLLLIGPQPPLLAGEIEIRVADEGSQTPLAANLYLQDARGRTFKDVRGWNWTPRNAPLWQDHLTIDGSIKLKLPTGRYTFELERGPEYQIRTGNFEISRNANGLENVTLRRFVDMSKEGWWSGDLHIHRPPQDLPLLMRAQDLHVAPVITWWNEQNAWKETPLPDQPLVALEGDYYYHLLAGEDERGGGALLYFNLEKPMELPRHDDREYPPMAKFLELASQQPGAHIDIEKPFWWDVPVWLALGMADSIGLANNHMLRDGMLADEAWGKPRDTTFYPAPRGNGYWSQDIYYHILNCGIRIPPSAGSTVGRTAKSGRLQSCLRPLSQRIDVGVMVGGTAHGRVVVTNGPLLRPLVNGQYPGHVFRGEVGDSISLVVNLNLSLRDKVDYLEVVQNGKVVHEVRLDELRTRKGALPPVEFQESGWMLVRAVVAGSKTFRFASTGPYYVEIGDKPRISRESAKFFLDWVIQRTSQLSSVDPAQQTEITRYLDLARNFWQQKLQHANAD